MIPINDVANVIEHVIDSQPTYVVEIFIRYTLFNFQQELYEQIYFVAMESPLSPIVENIYMEHFECSSAFDFSLLKMDLQVRYIHETNVKWPHAKEDLNKFVENVNSWYRHIQFTMELEDNTIPFLDILISEKEENSLNH